MKQQDTTESQMCEGAPNVQTTQDQAKRPSWDRIGQGGVSAQGQAEFTMADWDELMGLFLNGLYPKPGYRVTAMTYSKDAVYMKITKDIQTQTEDAELCD